MTQFITLMRREWMQHRIGAEHQVGQQRFVVALHLQRWLRLHAEQPAHLGPGVVADAQAAHRRALLQAQVREADGRAAAGQDRPLDPILELPHVPRPIVTLERRARVGRKLRGAVGRVMREEVRNARSSRQNTRRNPR